MCEAFRALISDIEAALARNRKLSTSAGATEDGPSADLRQQGLTKAGSRGLHKPISCPSVPSRILRAQAARRSGRSLSADVRQREKT